MKLKSLFIGAVAVILSACEPNGGNGPQQPSDLTLITETITAYADQEVVSVKVSGSGDWIAYTDNDWITVVTPEGIGDGSEFEVILKLKNNNTNEPRLGILSISARDDFFNVIINQSARHTYNITDFFKKVQQDNFKKMYICAHRANTYDGQKGRQDCPENSLPAVLRCIEKGIDMVEIDIRKTKDDQLICYHHSDLSVSTTGSGNPSDKTYEQICQYDMKLDNGTIVRGVKVPLLVDVLKACKGKIWVNLDLGKMEIKNSLILDAIEKADMFDEVTCYVGGAQNADKAKTLFNQSGGRLSPHLYIGSATDANKFNGLDVKALFQIGPETFFDGTTLKTDFTGKLRDAGAVTFCNHLDLGGIYPDNEAQAGNLRWLQAFAAAKVDFIQTDVGDHQRIQNYLKASGLR